MMASLLRSVLYAPADRRRVLDKLPSLPADGVIIDLEDAVAPIQKASGREQMRTLLRTPDYRAAMGDRFVAVRINALESEEGTEDLLAARAARPDAIVIPKVNGPEDIEAVELALAETDAPATLRLFAMIETARALTLLDAICATATRPGGRLAGLILGANDLCLETGMSPEDNRLALQPILSRLVLSARAAGLVALDGVFNAHGDQAGLEQECRQARLFGFDGKTLIHPAQIDIANAMFRPSARDVEDARAIVAAFGLPEHADAGAITLNGRMVERLHLDQAKRVLERHELAQARSG